MDSITHLFLGGAIAAAMAPKQHRRVAILIGAAINSLPDLDVVPLLLLNDDPVITLTWHRAATHSLLVLPWVAYALWWLLKSRWTPVREDPRRWFWLIQVTLLAHPLIDGFTVYGTQLLWPLPVPPVMWSSLFIIDPFFTFPLFLACVIAWRLRDARSTQRVLVFGLARGGAHAGRLSRRRAFAGCGPGADSDIQGLRRVSTYPVVARLLWFSHGFMKAETKDGRLVLSDLRMGAEPDYSFRFAVATRRNGDWRATPVEQLKWPWLASRRLPEVWRRIWTPVIAGEESR